MQRRLMNGNQKERKELLFRKVKSDDMSNWHEYERPTVLVPMVVRRIFSVAQFFLKRKRSFLIPYGLIYCLSRAERMYVNYLDFKHLDRSMGKFMTLFLKSTSATPPEMKYIIAGMSKLTIKVRSVEAPSHIFHFISGESLDIFWSAAIAVAGKSRAAG